MRFVISLFGLLATSSQTGAFLVNPPLLSSSSPLVVLRSSSSSARRGEEEEEEDTRTTPLSDRMDRRELLKSISSSVAVTTLGSIVSASTAATTAVFLPTRPADAVGPVKVPLTPIKYFAQPCPPSKPIPGQMAMRGMRGLCVTVDAKVDEASPKDLEKVGVYGFITDAESGDSVLANNPDLSTDAGQFAIIEYVKTTDKTVQFEFVAAIPKDVDISKFDTGITPLSFQSLRLVSFPGGQQYGAINPCEMNEFSDECEVWEKENGPYERGDFMVKSNPRTKGR